jgi:transposase-like protein
MAPGVSVGEVAQRYGLLANHLSTWRSMVRRGELAPPVPTVRPDFATVVVEEDALNPLQSSQLDETPSPVGSVLMKPRPIEVEVKGVILRLDPEIDVQRLADLMIKLTSSFKALP